VRQKNFADVDGGLSGVSRCADTGARTPIGVSVILFSNFDSLEFGLNQGRQKLTCHFLSDQLSFQLLLL
jgi:hypothetical protein